MASGCDETETIYYKPGFSLAIIFITIMVLAHQWCHSVSVGALSTLILMPAELIVYEGENATFNCSGFTPRGPVALTNENNVVDERISTIEKHETFETFQLSDVRRSDDGRRFRCVLHDTLSNTCTIRVYG